jgi:hypothetical protein
MWGEMPLGARTPQLRGRKRIRVQPLHPVGARAQFQKQSTAHAGVYPQIAAQRSTACFGARDLASPEGGRRLSRMLVQIHLRQASIRGIRMVKAATRCRGRGGWNEIPRISAPAFSLKERRDHQPRLMLPSGRWCDGCRSLLGRQPTQSGAGQQFSEFRFL